MRRSPSRRVLLAAVAVVAAAAGLLVFAFGALPRLESDSVDLRFGLRGAHRPAEVVVVAIDDVTFSDLRLHWPFARHWHARAIDVLHAAGARQIVYDVQFTEQTAPREDYALYDAIGRAGGAVLATTEADAHGQTNVLGGNDNLRAIHAVAGASNLPAATGGVIRRYSYMPLPGLMSLPVAAAAMLRGRPLSRAGFTRGDALIDYQGPPGTVRTVSFSDLVRGRVDLRVLAGKIVVVGATAPTLQDVHPTPTSGSDVMSGPEIQANAIWTALHGNPLRDAPGWLAWLAITAGALLAPLAAMRLNVLRATLLAASVAGGYVVAVQLAFNSGTVVVLSYPLLAWAAGTAGMVVASYLSASAERRTVSIRADRLEGTVRQRELQLLDSQLEIVRRLADAAESRDGDTGEHILRVGLLCEQLGRAAGMTVEEAWWLRHASAMHDVGKLGIPDSILLKPGPLDQAEWAVMRTHAVRGAEILSGSTSPLLQMAETIARTHHERWDGSGYPLGLRGEQIPLVGRIVAICDVFDALCSQRPYKRPWRPGDALAEIERSAGTRFDPDLAQTFLRLAPRLLAGLSFDAAQQAARTPALPADHAAEELVDPRIHSMPGASGRASG